MIDVLLAAGQAGLIAFGFTIAGYGVAAIVRDRPLNPERSRRRHRA